MKLNKEERFIRNIIIVVIIFRRSAQMAEIKILIRHAKECGERAEQHKARHDKRHARAAATAALKQQCIQQRQSLQGKDAYAGGIKGAEHDVRAGSVGHFERRARAALQKEPRDYHGSNHISSLARGNIPLPKLRQFNRTAAAAQRTPGQGLQKRRAQYGAGKQLSRYVCSP